MSTLVSDSQDREQAQPHDRAQAHIHAQDQAHVHAQAHEQAAVPAENSMALAGGVIGILALPLAVMFGWWLPFVVPVVACLGLALSGEGLRRVRREGWPDKAWAIVGVATSGLALGLGVLGTLIQFSALI